MAELFHEDPAFAALYLNDILEEGGPADLLIALRQMAQAFGGVPSIAERNVRLHRESSISVPLHH